MFSEGKACVLCGFPAPLGHRACPVTELSTYIAQNNYSGIMKLDTNKSDRLMSNEFYPFK